jgi:hypothetical protein
VLNFTRHFWSWEWIHYPSLFHHSFLWIFITSCKLVINTHESPYLDLLKKLSFLPSIVSRLVLIAIKMFPEQLYQVLNSINFWAHHHLFICPRTYFRNLTSVVNLTDESTATEHASWKTSVTASLMNEMEWLTVNMGVAHLYWLHKDRYIDAFMNTLW